MFIQFKTHLINWDNITCVEPYEDWTVMRFNKKAYLVKIEYDDFVRTIQKGIKQDPYWLNVDWELFETLW